MKPFNKRIILYAIGALGGLSVAMSCGQGFGEKGHNEILNRAATPNAMTGIQSQLSEGQLTDYVPSSQLAGNMLGHEASFSQQLDVPRAQANLEPDLNAAPFMNVAPNAISGVPYYCNPGRFPPNITSSAAGCKNFQGIPPQGFPPHRIHDHLPGKYNYAYANGLFDPVGYRVKPFVGTIGARIERFGRHHHDDDDGGYRRNRSFHNGNKFRSNGGGKWHNRIGSRSHRRHRNDLEKVIDLGPGHPSDAAKEPLENDGTHPANDLGPRHPSDSAKSGVEAFKFSDD